MLRRVAAEGARVFLLRILRNIPSPPDFGGPTTAAEPRTFAAAETATVAARPVNGRGREMTGRRPRLWA
jgi:hypothetical protein